MRLLPKSELDKKKASQRQREIEEGLKLTRRVDSLREVAAEEDTKLEKYRAKTVAAIQAEIGPLDIKLGTLKKEIKELEDTRKNLLVPLDAEWKKVETVKETLEKDRLYVRSMQREVIKDRKEAASLLVKAEDNKIHTEVMEKKAADGLKDVTIKLRDASEIMEQAGITKKAAEVYQNEGLATIAEENRKLGLRTEALVMKEEEVAIEQADLAVAKIQMLDREQTLQRNLKRKS